MTHRDVNLVLLVRVHGDGGTSMNRIDYMLVDGGVILGACAAG